MKVGCGGGDPGGPVPGRGAGEGEQRAGRQPQRQGANPRPTATGMIEIEVASSKMYISPPLNEHFTSSYLLNYVFNQHLHVLITFS